MSILLDDLLMIEQAQHALGDDVEIDLLVPPSIELALARSQPRIAASSAGVKPSPSQPRPWLPMASTISSVRSWLSLAPAYFMIEVAALGPLLGLASSCDAAHGQREGARVHLVLGDARAQVGVGDPAVRRRRRSPWPHRSRS